MANAQPNNELMKAWRTTDWRKLERRVFKLQTRIHKAAIRGDVRTVRKLQKTLMKSWSNRMLAVRRVTQDNRGRNTAGVDGVKALSPVARIRLARVLKITGKSQPTRRVWIPKPGKDEKRPLGIPTMYDRALQAVVKAALEPEWEAYFEPNSYGFRPGRSCHDAIAQIKLCLQHAANYVLDADIAKCFDKIDHKVLLNKLNIRGNVRSQIKSWLKSGVIDMGVFADTKEGTPQGGVISPLLANIALHGMERMLDHHFPETKSGHIQKSSRKYGYLTYPPKLVRYADDFVVMAENPTVIQECKQLIAEWLRGIGLELRPEKTRLTHSLADNLSEDGKAGFDFLGFHVQQYHCSIYRCNETTHGKPTGWVLFVTPSKDKRKRHQGQIQAIIKAGRYVEQAGLISKLNPIIRGWSNYYQHSDTGTTGEMSRQDHLMYLTLRKWGNRRCKGSTKDAHKKYWKTVGYINWVFASRTDDGKSGVKLVQHSDTDCSSTAYIKVKGTRSPYDGDFVYWSKRTGKHPEIPTRVALLLKKQKGKCAHCGLYFHLEDVMEVDHAIPTAAGGLNKWDNLQLLHGHCHDFKSVGDRVLIKKHKEATDKTKQEKRKAKQTKRRNEHLSREEDAQLALEEELRLLLGKS